MAAVSPRNYGWGFWVEDGDFEWDVDSWYSIDEVYKYAEFGGGVYEGDQFFTGFKYFINEQTFATINFEEESANTMYLAGSYLFNNDFFLGAAILTNDHTKVSSGYRFNLTDEKSFVAASIDYKDYKGKAMIEGKAIDNLFALEVNSKFFINNALIEAGFWVPDDSDVDTTYYFSSYIKVYDNLVIGADLIGKDSDLYASAGLTWKPEPFIVDAQVGVDGIDFDDDKYFFYLSGMYRLNDNFSFGCEVDKYEDYDTEYSIKFKYATDKNTFAAVYAFDNDWCEDGYLWLNNTWYFE